MFKLKRSNILGLIISSFMVFNSYVVCSADDSIKDMGKRIVTDTNKVWTIGFKSEADISSMSNNVEVMDLTSGNVFTPTVNPGDNNYSVKVSAPSGGYVTGHKYKLTLKNGIKSKVGKALPKATVVTFSVLSPNSSYTISTNVSVSPVIDVFKTITINSTNFSDAAKYKIEGNDSLVDIGKPLYSIVIENTVKVYICDSQGNVLGTANLDVSTSKSNVDLKLNFET